MFKFLFLLLISSDLHTCSHFNLDNVQIFVIQQPTIYFGYSLLLQISDPPSVIVGAPKQNDEHPSGGALYKCNLNYGNCTLFDGIADSRRLSKIGNWLGSVLDGDATGERAIFTCAPKHIFHDYAYKFYAPNGKCLEIDYFGKITTRDPLRLENQVSIKDSQRYLNCSYAELGFDMQYLPREEHYLVYGVPGLELWQGGIIIQSKKSIKILPLRLQNIHFDFQYLGYSVRGARFENTSTHVWYAVGAPRGTNYFGHVLILYYNPYTRNRIKTIFTITGEEMGAYFGASLLIEDLNGDWRKDLLIGAPTGSGKTYDEGYVYYYEFNGGLFTKKSVLYGSKSPAARFGTTMARLGDINLDGFNDVAISAPYEDGQGAVYIYLGSKENLVFGERITPQHVQRTVPGSGVIRGFGFGLSRGSDIDGNGFNDLAIGAYLSNTVFVFKTKPLIDYRITIESDLRSLLTNISEFNVSYCVNFKWRSNKVPREGGSFNFTTTVQIDPRGMTKDTLKLHKIVNYSNLTGYCDRIAISLEESAILSDILTPFEFRVNGSIVDDRNVSGIGEEASLSLPFLHECGEDNICQPDLELTASVWDPNVIVGETKELKIDVFIRNKREPAYECKLIINQHEDMELRNTQNCQSNSNAFICALNDAIVDSKRLPLVFDVKEDINPRIEFLNVSFSVTCLDGSSVATQLDIPIRFVSKPYISGISNPLQLEYPNDDEINTVTHIFNFGNAGPSPVCLETARILVPQPVDEKGEPIIRIVEAKNYVNNVEHPCQIRNITYSSNVDVPLIAEQNQTTPAGNTINIDCQTGNNCVRIVCEDGGYLRKSQTSLVFIKFRTDLKLLNDVYNKEMNIDLITVTSSVHFTTNDREIISAHAPTSIFIANEILLPFWILITTPIVGCVLLIVLTYVLYRCNFFKRNYRDKLKDEILSESLLQPTATKGE